MASQTNTLSAADLADPARLKGLLSGFSVISCDIFDTAVTRLLARPDDVHLATGARLLARGLCDVRPEAFREYRVAAEHVLRKNLREREEILLQEVYDFLAKSGVVRDAARAAQEELAAEKAVLRPVPAVRDALTALSPGQRLVFVSDTLLPGAWLKSMLTDLGFGTDFQVYCSADIGFTKHSGKIFSKVLAKLDCAPSQVVHLGDNFRSDVSHAGKAGLATIFLPRQGFPPEKEALASRHFLARLLASARRVHSRENPQPQGRITLAGYFTCLLLGYTLFILEQARRRSIRRIYFLARDGYLPHLFAQEIVKVRKLDLELIYLHVSRRAIVLPLLASDLAQLAHEISQNTLGRPLVDSLGFLDLEEGQASRLVIEAGLDPQTRIANPDAPQLVHRLFAAHAELVTSRLRLMGERATAYLGSTGFLEPGAKIVADLGWKGSTQKALGRIEGVQAQDILGCYLGLWAECLSPGELTPQNAQGYLFEFGYPKRNMEIVRDGYGVLELVFSAPHGSVLHYDEKNGEVVPVHAVEPQGARQEEFIRLRDECLRELRVLEAMVSGAWPDGIDPDSALFDVEGLLTRPSREEVEYIAPIAFIGGINGGPVSGTVKPMGMRQLLRDPEAALRVFESMPWRAGSLRASLPAIVPSMTFGDFRHRMRRVRQLLRLGR